MNLREVIIHKQLKKIINEAVATRLVLERMVGMGYVSKGCAVAAWEQHIENMDLVNRFALTQD